ncbi:putative T7SS-secreted protein [Streptomyces sp. TR06-5]|uniref:WXG100 family type VII secretion target n=1 Tax=Streptomyces sp. TR06-5 TaxID=3385976 RepID=UPI0039A01E92
MAHNPFPHLGWNPVPGIPSEVDSLVSKVKKAADALRDSQRKIDRLVGESSYWEGDAADAFRGALEGELQEYMKNAARSMEKATAHLKAWDENLSSNRDLAKKYDDEAKEKKAAADGAKTAYDTACKDPDLNLGGREYPSQAEADAATSRLKSAEKRLREASTTLQNANTAFDEVIKKAKSLDGTHKRQAQKIADQLDLADDKLAPKEPGWLESTLDTIGNGLKSIGEFLLDHAGTIGAIAGLLALMPTPFAPIFAGIAIAASAASMGKNLASEDFRDSLMGEHGWGAGLTAWGSMVGDGLGMVPGVGVLGRAGGEVSMVAGVAREGGEAMSAGAKLTTFGRETASAFNYSALDAATSAKTLDYALNGTNVAANSVSSLETEGVLPDEGAGHYANEGAKAGIAGAGASGTLTQFGSDMGDLIAGLRL